MINEKGRYTISDGPDKKMKQHMRKLVLEILSPLDHMKVDGVPPSDIFKATVNAVANFAFSSFRVNTAVDYLHDMTAALNMMADHWAENGEALSKKEDLSFDDNDTCP
ncbi:hypothetical protein KGP36_07455 [Patescibacteria group bacterium]|nr:hypothetical protein [Patescibacteria group bacterium]